MDFNTMIASGGAKAIEEPLLDNLLCPRNAYEAAIQEIHVLPGHKQEASSICNEKHDQEPLLHF